MSEKHKADFQRNLLWLSHLTKEHFWEHCTPFTHKYSTWGISLLGQGPTGVYTSKRYRQTLQIMTLTEILFKFIILSLSKDTLWLKYEPDWVKWKENKPQTNDIETDWWLLSKAIVEFLVLIMVNTTPQFFKVPNNFD